MQRFRSPVSVTVVLTILTLVSTAYGFILSTVKDDIHIQQQNLRDHECIANYEAVAIEHRLTAIEVTLHTLSDGVNDLPKKVVEELNK